MIEIRYAEQPHELKITGHADYNSGQDIVCAGVSAITYALLQYLEDRGIQTDAGRKGASVICSEDNKEVRTAFEMALTGYQMIAEEYPDNVRVTIA